MHGPNTTIDELITAIVEELGKPLNDPRTLANQTSPLASFVRAEVRRRIDWLRSPSQALPVEMPTMVDVRHAIKALSRVAFTITAQTTLAELKAVEQEPPEKADPLKYECAAEAYFVMECFSKKPITGTEGGAFRMIAAYIHEAVTGKVINSKRACELVLKQRRRYA
jgi:hypothetical protein